MVLCVGAESIRPNSPLRVRVLRVRACVCCVRVRWTQTMGR